MEKVKVLIVLAGSIFAQSCANVDHHEVAAQATKQTIEHQQEMDKSDGRSRSTKIEKESIINGGIAAIWCSLFSEKCQQKNKPD